MIQATFRLHLSSVISTLLASLSYTSGRIPKRGLAYNDGVPIERFGPNSQVNWQYNWDSTTGNAQPWSEFIPMLWGLQDIHTSHWVDRAAYWIRERGTMHLLGFNEPDHPEQSCMTVDAAVGGYRVHLQPFLGVAQIGTPAVTNAGYEWLREFLARCNNGCEVHFVAVHWYNPWWMVEDFKNWVHRVCLLAGGRQVWITEFKGWGSPEEQSEFLRQVTPWLDSNPCVGRYAYFGVAYPNMDLLMNGGPGLSDLGSQYAYSLYGA